MSTKNVPPLASRDLISYILSYIFLSNKFEKCDKTQHAAFKKRRKKCRPAFLHKVVVVAFFFFFPRVRGFWENVRQFIPRLRFCCCFEVEISSRTLIPPRPSERLCLLFQVLQVRPAVNIAVAALLSIDTG